MIVNLQEAPSVLTLVAQWQFQEWGWQYPGQTVHDRLMQLQQHLSSSSIPATYVAFADDFLAGIVSLVVHDMVEHPALSPWLASLYVAPKYRNKGLGTRLVKHAEKAAYEMGYNALFLYTGEALGYFLDRDWEAIHTMQRGGGQVVVMQRDLSTYESGESDVANEPPDDQPTGT
jgi:GNAT superfamily N-acetyltransferase